MMGEIETTISSLKPISDIPHRQQGGHHECLFSDDEPRLVFKPGKSETRLSVEDQQRCVDKIMARFGDVGMPTIIFERVIDSEVVGVPVQWNFDGKPICDLSIDQLTSKQLQQLQKLISRAIMYYLLDGYVDLSGSCSPKDLDRLSELSFVKYLLRKTDPFFSTNIMVGDGGVFFVDTVDTSVDCYGKQVVLTRAIRRGIGRVLSIPMLVLQKGLIAREQLGRRRSSFSVIRGNNYL